MNEWQFTSDVAKWMTSILEKSPDLPFSEAYCEGQSPNSPKRRDLSIKDRNGRLVLTGEVKLPGRKDGATPYNDKVVADARSKAQRAQVPFFFTWNVNECVLWETEPKHLYPRPDYKRWQIANLSSPRSLEFPDVQQQIKKWLPIFFRDVADILRGASFIEKKSPDEKFIDALEAALGTPIVLTYNALYEKYRYQANRDEINYWMRDELGFTIFSDSDGIRNNLDSASKHSCYGLANKLVFYEALLKRYGASLEALNVPEHISTGDNLRTHFEGFFARAKKVTRDYETVFGENALGLGSRVPFYNDGVIEFWRAFVDEIHVFDFSRLDYEVIGSIFERLISPEERHKYGQFYTRVEVVDLINSFAIRTGDETLIDPACGGGTFLVRAYARKRELAPYRSHSQRLQDLYGVDISRFATHLTTINLATRDLVDDENYPQIARSDFFNIRPYSTIISLPRTIKTSGLGKSQSRDVQIPLLDAVVGNPPYIRQECIPKSSKEKYQKIAKQKDAKLSARSDIHCYFWTHSISFLKEDGYLCFLTSSQWLDTNYGFKLQDFILRNFDIVAVLESLDEPWFIGARVVTTVTILRRSVDEKQRMQNTVRFIQLRQPIAEILANDGTTAGAIQAADRFRDELLNLTENTRNFRYRVRLIKQGNLWDEGVRLSIAMSKSGEADQEENIEEDILTQAGKYYGGKWGVYLRAPDEWFDLLDRFTNYLTPLAEIAEIRFGVKTGKDIFFFPKDATEEALKTTDAKEFQLRFGAELNEVVSGEVKIVRCGEGYEEMRPVESCFLEPEVHSIMDWERFSVTPDECQRMILLVPSDYDSLIHKYVHRYIEWGEEQGYPENPTCQGRVTEARKWFDLTDYPRASVILPKIQQYRLFTILNEKQLYQASALLGVFDIYNLTPALLAAILNSTISILSRLQYARVLGNEGNIQLDVYSANMMLVPDPRQATITHQQKVVKAFNKMKERIVLSFLSEKRLRRMSYTEKGKEAELSGLSDETELTQSDRRELDNAVLEMLGISSAIERTKIMKLMYSYLADFFEWTRQKEEKAIQNKNQVKRRQGVRLSDIARELFEQIKENNGAILRSYDNFLDHSQPFDTYEVPKDGKPERLDNLFQQHAIEFLSKAQASLVVETRSEAQRELLLLVVQQGTRGFIRIPLDDVSCQNLYSQYSNFLRQRADSLRAIVEETTADPELQEKIYADLLRRIQAASE